MRASHAPSTTPTRHQRQQSGQISSDIPVIGGFQLTGSAAARAVIGFFLYRGCFTNANLEESPDDRRHGPTP
jgi:hypothetical protein